MNRECQILLYQLVHKCTESVAVLAVDGVPVFRATCSVTIDGEEIYGEIVGKSIKTKDGKLIPHPHLL